MWSDKQKEYSNEFYTSVLLDIVRGEELKLIEEVLRVLEDEEDYEACDGIIKGIRRCEKASFEEILNELDELGIDYPKKLRKI